MSYRHTFERDLVGFSEWEREEWTITTDVFRGIWLCPFVNRNCLFSWKYRCSQRFQFFSKYQTNIEIGNWYHSVFKVPVNGLALFYTKVFASLERTNLRVSIVAGPLDQEEFGKCVIFYLCYIELGCRFGIAGRFYLFTCIATRCSRYENECRYHIWFCW